MGREREKLVYPSVKREDKTVTYKHGGKITDSYQWLENTNSQEVKNFVHSENEVTIAYLEKCQELNKIQTDLRSMSNHRKISCPTEHTATNSLYFFMNDDAASSDSLYVQKGRKGKPEVLLSPKNIPSNSTKCSYFLRMYNLSRDGQTLAYAFSTKESKWLSIRFKEVATRKDLPEILKNVCMSDISWTVDNKGILYSCYCDEKAVDHKVVFHRIGEDQLSDVVLVEFPNRPNMTIQAQVSDCGEMIYVYGRLNDDFQTLHFYYGDFNFTTEDDYVRSPLLFHLIGGKGLEIQYLANEENTVYLRTNHKAPNFRIVMINLCTYDRLTTHAWQTVIPEDSERVLDWADATHKLELRQLNGTLIHKYSLPIGTIIDYFGGPECPRFYFTFTSFLVPDCVRYIELSESCSKCCQILNPWGRKRIRFFNKDLQKQFDTSSYRMKQLFCNNPVDNTSIPVFVIHKKGLRRNGTSPCMIYAQGCFGVQAKPSFSISKWAFLCYFDGVVAIVGVRGGGEYGDKWYRDVCGIDKQNSYADFIAATEFLINLGYTSASKLILEGEAYGGNLAAVCMTQRPELYSAVIIHDGLLDMLRFHLFQESQEYLKEFGDPENEENFKILQSVSPVHNIIVKTENFPAIMAILGKGGCLSHPSNSFKFVAQVQNDIASTFPTFNHPCLLRSKRKGKSSEDASKFLEDVLYKTEERADILAFIIQSLKLKLKRIK